MRFYPTKDCSFYSERLNAWDRLRTCPAVWENHVDRPEIYWPEIATRIPLPVTGKEKKPKPPPIILDKRGCPIPPVIPEPIIMVRQKPVEEKFIKVIYYFRDLEGAKMKRIEDKDLYFDYPKKIPPSPKRPPREMSLSLKDYREKLKREADEARAARLAARLAYLNANKPAC